MKRNIDNRFQLNQYSENILLSLETLENKIFSKFKEEYVLEKSISCKF